MAITKTQLEEAVVRALRAVGTQWANDQKDVLNTIAASQTKLLGLPPMFQAAAWLNTGLNATKTLFPNSAIVGAAARLSVPIAIVDSAMGLFRAAHEHEISRRNALLAKDYVVLKEKLQNMVGKSAVDLPNTPFGRKTCEVVLSVVSRRMKDLDLNMVESHCANVIQHAEFGVIETDVTKIRQRTEEGFLAICNKIYDVYRIPLHTSQSSPSSLA